MCLDKYKIRGPGYHWEQISNSILKHNAFVITRYRLIIKLLKKYSRKKDNTIVLDAGCGDGALTYLISKEGFQVKGIDISELAINYAKRMYSKYNTQSEFSVSSVYAIPYENDSFDFTVCADVIEHVEYPNKLLEELKRTTKYGGYIIISTPVKFTEHPIDKAHINEWYPSEFIEVLKNVFPGGPLEIFYSHPLFWYELYNKPKRLFRLGRYLINLFSIMGFYNVFEERRMWRFFMMQTCIIENVK